MQNTGAGGGSVGTGTEPGLSPWWRHAAILVMIFGFTILTIVTVNTYSNAPPIPARVVDDKGATLFDRATIERGQEVFFKYGLMEHGTLWGHGAYLGPDYSAEYLHRLAEISYDTAAQECCGRPYADLTPAEAAAVADRVKQTLRENRYDANTGDLRFSAGEAASFARQREEWREYFAGTTPAPGLPAGFIRDPEEIRALTAYFSWAAWVTVAARPGKDYTYTNNWPYEPLVGNRPSTSAYLWSGLSLVSLLSGLGLVLLVFGKFDFLGWRGAPGAERRDLGQDALARWTLTPSQKVTGLYFAVVAILFLLQTMAGGALAHYRVESGSFYGLDLASVLPYNLLRTWHLQLAIFWIATAWVAGGLFLAPLVGGAEPRGQKTGALVLLGALAVVVFGSLTGEYLGINNRLGNLWFWLGHQGSEYLDLGRFWQVLLAVGLVLWLVLMFRALLPAMRRGGKDSLASLFLYAAVAIPVFYLPALFYGPHTNYAVIDNWRFWIIHLWVEGFFELFATVLVAVIFFQIGMVSARTATRVVYLDAILYLGAGVIGTGHHWYFTGQGTLNMGLAACFSALEVVPLTLLTLDAWDFIRLQNRAEGGTHPAAARQKWAIAFLIAVGVWNFVGAGVFGFLINLPVISYFEMGTGLTTNHGHAALFGVFGMLALGVLVFCLRASTPDARWARSEPLVRVGFWGLNVGLALMCLIDLFPAGVLQLVDSLQHGYWHARRLTFTMTGLFHTLEWLRMFADVIFLIFGVCPIVAATLRATLGRGEIGDRKPAPLQSQGPSIRPRTVDSPVQGSTLASSSQIGPSG
jgi:nitric oxide reductase subunit B